VEFSWSSSSHEAVKMAIRPMAAQPCLRRNDRFFPWPAPPLMVGARLSETKMAGLSTHVLDTVRGGPAEGVEIELFGIDPDGSRLSLARVRTNSDGRTDAPLISAAAARVGTFELIFHIGDYFRRSGARAAEPPFLDAIPIRFSVADPKAHYHVPLLASPWSYSTYRGS
jgi:5-hydroxyisourate hydrolase